MPEIVDGPGGPERAAQALANGRLVALPTESGYEIAAPALQPAAVAQLQNIAGHEPVAIVLTTAGEAADWLPYLGPPASRLLRKFGPGPWQLIADGGADFGLAQRLTEPVRIAVCPERHLAMRWPDRPSWALVARFLKQPLMSAGLTPALTTAAQAAESLGDSVALIMDGGPCSGAGPVTRLRVTGKQWQIERPGGLPADAVQELLVCRVLFVCTGNTCRSPMAEALMTRLLSDRLGCLPEELAGRGFLVQSAGLAAMMGTEASPDAIAAVRECGADLSAHRSQRLTLDQMLLADHVFAMTESHLWALQNVDVPDLPTPQLLSPDGEDVPDPIGAEPEVYRACAREILGHLQKRLPEIL
jgi:protein-tyrosine phosphatase